MTARGMWTVFNPCNLFVFARFVITGLALQLSFFGFILMDCKILSNYLDNVIVTN